MFQIPQGIADILGDSLIECWLAGFGEIRNLLFGNLIGLPFQGVEFVGDQLVEGIGVFLLGQFPEMGLPVRANPCISGGQDLPGSAQAMACSSALSNSRSA